jgi:hypothetical protein
MPEILAGPEGAWCEFGTSPVGRSWIASAAQTEFVIDRFLALSGDRQTAEYLITKLR